MKLWWPLYILIFLITFIQVIALYITGSLDEVLGLEHKKEMIRYLYNHQVFIYLMLFTYSLNRNLSIFFVTPILNVSRKFSMRIIFSIGYIKIYNISSTNEYFIQQNAFIQSTIQYYTSKYVKYILKVHDILQRLRTSSCWNIHPSTCLLKQPVDLQQIRIEMRHNVSVSST